MSDHVAFTLAITNLGKEYNPDKYSHLIKIFAYFAGAPHLQLLSSSF